MVWTSANGPKCPVSPEDRGEDMEPAPKRIQRKRTRGWKMPKNTVYVGRPGKFGNPLPKPFEQAMYRTWLCGSSDRAKHVLDGLAELRGKNLACWCGLDQPCHADVLLDIANGLSLSRPDREPTSF